jgi:hypothetical protein
MVKILCILEQYCKDYCINRGIHVYLSSSSELVTYDKTSDSILVEVRAKEEDLLGCDKEIAVFTKIEIAKKEWEKAKKAWENRMEFTNYNVL